MPKVGDLGYSIRWGAGTQLCVREVQEIPGSQAGGILTADIVETYYNQHDREIIASKPILFSEWRRAS